MINSLVQTYKCPECNTDVKDNNVDIVGAAGNTINIDVECPKCKKHSMIKSEVLSINLNKFPISKEKLSEMKTSLKQLQQINQKMNIKDEDIVDLNKILKQKDINVSDLFSQDENEETK